MKLLIALVVVLAIVFFVWKLLLRSKKLVDLKERWPFYSVKLMSEVEQVFYFRLVKALPEHIVFSQVQLSRLMKVKKGYPNQKWRNRIDRLSADFVVCNKDSSIVAVIELDDATHDKAARIKTDAKKDHALRSADIKIIRFRVDNLPNEIAIKEIFEIKKPE